MRRELRRRGLRSGGGGDSGGDSSGGGGGGDGDGQSGRTASAGATASEGDGKQSASSEGAGGGGEDDESVVTDTGDLLVFSLLGGRWAEAYMIRLTSTPKCWPALHAKTRHTLADSGQHGRVCMTFGCPFGAVFHEVVTMLAQ